MKDSLSLLSRGCGRRHNGRLDVCFTPQDYYIRKSQDSLVRLSDSGRLLAGAESTLPKTYSTRRGPLLLYSQDLVTVETSCDPKPRDRKQRVVRGYSQPMEQQLSTLKELTAAILSYSNSQFPSSRLGPPFVPPLHHPLAPDLHRPTPAAICTMQEQFMPELLVQLNPQLPPLERNAEQLENKPEDKDEEQGSRKRVRLDLFLQVPCSSRTPSPQVEPQAWVHYVTVTPEEPEEHQTYSEMSHAERRNHHQQAGELHHLNTNCVRDVADDQGCSIQDGRTSGDGHQRSMSGSRHGRTGLLPPLTEGRSARHGHCWEKTDKPTWEVMSGDEHHAQRLPPIAESCSVTPSRATQREARPKADTAAFKSQENVKRLHQQPLFLPLLFPEEIHGKQRGEGEKTEKRHFKKVTVGQGGGGGGGGGSMIVMQPGAEPPPPPPPGGALGCVAGRKGPGRQSSLAFLQNQDPCEPSDASRGVVRGLLPLQLRDLQDGRSAGSLILGPDGEIIQLSLYDSQDPSHGDGDTRDQALQVLSAEGEKLPWVIVLQPEHTHAEGGVELHTDIQHHQSVHKRTERHVSVGQFAAAESSFSSEQLLELHRSSNACSPGSHADPVDVTQKKRKNAEAETWTGPKKDAKTVVRMPPMKEQVEKEVLKGGHAETEEDEDEEEQHSTGQTNSLSGSHQQREKLQLKDEASRSRRNINPDKTEDAVDKRKKNTKRKEAEEAAITTGKRDGKTMKSAASDGQKRSGTRKEGKWQREKTGSDARPIRSQRKEERTSREAAETLEHSALPSKKKMTNREGERGEVMMKEEREESAGRKRRRGRLKLKELVAGNHEDPLENEEVEVNQRMEEESRPESTKTPSATQRHSNKTNTSLVGDADISTSADDRSSVRSVSSLISAAAASQLHKSSWRRSAASSCEGTVLASAGGLTPSRGRLSSCSAVMVTEEQLMLNPVKPESSRPTKSQEDEAAALRQRAEKRRQEVERKRREQEEEERKQQERERTEERMKSELEEERRKRAEELRLKRLAEEEDRRKREEEEQERARREQAQRERERRRQEERRRQMERLQRKREEEEQRRKAELERLRLEEERRQEEESKKLQEMDESERMEYLRRKEQEEEDRRQKEEERKRKEEEAALWAAEEARLQAELLARQVALLQQQLAFKRGLVFEAGGLEKTQGISRPWIYSYFTLLQLLGLNPTKAETTSPDL